MWSILGTELDKKKAPKVHLAKNESKGGKANMLCRSAPFWVETLQGSSKSYLVRIETLVVGS